MDPTASRHAERDHTDDAEDGAPAPREGGESDNARDDARGDAAQQPSGVGREAIPAGTERSTHEHESGYGGKKDNPRVSSDRRPGT